MEKLIALFEKEFIDEAGKVPEHLTSKDIPFVTIVGSLAASYLAAKELGKDGHHIMRHDEMWKDDIKDELESAEEKYRQYKQSGDPVMLDMARQELSHAHYYITHAQMSPDEKLREKLPEYQATFDRLEKMISEPHGTEKVPVLV